MQGFYRVFGSIPVSRLPGIIKGPLSSTANLGVVATAFGRPQVCCSVTVQHSGAQNLTLGLPRCSGVACATMQRSNTPVHNGVGSAALALGHVPYARLVATQPTGPL